MSRTWSSRDLRAPWKICDIELTEPLEPVSLSGAYGAYLLMRYKGRPSGRLLVGRSYFGDEVSVERLDKLVRWAGFSLASAYAVRDQLLQDKGRAPLPPTTIAVCTRNRADLLQRTLKALVDMRNSRNHDECPIDILVVDNAPPDGATRDVANAFDGVRYAVEPIPGLDFGRNRALAETDRQFIGFIDDDATPDRGWIEGFAESLRDRPDAGAFTGPVLPMSLETEAQVRFEAGGGFGSGIERECYQIERWEDPIYPAGAGRLVTGTNMIFRVETLKSLGGFDEALDTGPPLPGGGDIDMCYRVVRAGWPLVYSPLQAVHHEHRRDLPGLRKQFRSWGLSIGALSQKNRVTDPDTRRKHWNMIGWLFSVRYARTLAGYPIGRASVPPSFVFAEISGLMQGLAGEYERSVKRVAKRREEFG